MSERVNVKVVETEEEWEAVRSLRVRVFVDEQGVPLPEEFDEHDEGAVHVAALIAGRVVGAGRVYTSGTGETQIGRMAVDADYRREGIGGLVLAFLEQQAALHGVREVMLHAQTYVKSFYERRGYASDSEPFLEVDIEHVRMVKRLPLSRLPPTGKEPPHDERRQKGVDDWRYRLHSESTASHVQGDLRNDPGGRQVGES